MRAHTGMKVLAVGVTVLALAATATADSLTITRIAGTFAGSGGEFNITPLNGPATGAIAGTPGLGTNPFSFQSFCVEYSEHVKIGATYDYVINTGAVNGGLSGQDPSGGDFDPLDPKTAYVYTQFINGTLSGSDGTTTYQYDYNQGAGRNASAKALQQAIWKLEGEWSDPLTGEALAYYNTANSSTWTDIGNVRVMNLYASGGTGAKQDQLIMIPTPIALLMGLPLLGAVGVFRSVRRRDV